MGIGNCVSNTNKKNMRETKTIKLKNILCRKKYNLEMCVEFKDVIFFFWGGGFDCNAKAWQNYGSPSPNILLTIKEREKN